MADYTADDKQLRVEPPELYLLWVITPWYLKRFTEYKEEKPSRGSIRWRYKDLAVGQWNTSYQTQATRTKILLRKAHSLLKQLLLVMGKVSYSIHILFLIIFRQNSWLNVSLRSGSFLVEALKCLYSFNTAEDLTYLGSQNSKIDK